MNERYRGVVLPDRMTPACLKELASLLNWHCDEDSEESNEDAAVRAFGIVLRSLQDRDDASFLRKALTDMVGLVARLAGSVQPGLGDDPVVRNARAVLRGDPPLGWMEPGAHDV
jgi:hypothetical protein